MEEVGTDTKTGRELVKIDAAYFRPAEVETLLGDPSKIEKELGCKFTGAICRRLWCIRLSIPMLDWSLPRSVLTETRLCF